MFKWAPLLWANLTRRRVRTAFTMVAVATSFALFGLLESFRYALSTYADDYADSLVVQSRDTPLPISHVGHLRAMQGVRTACGVMFAHALSATGKRVLIQSVCDETLFEIHPGMRLDAAASNRWRTERIAVLVDEQTAAEHDWAPGDRIMLRGQEGATLFDRADGLNALEVLIAGVYSATNALAAQGVFARYEYVRDAVGPARAGLEYIAVRLRPGEDVDPMRERIDMQFRNSAAPTKSYSYRALLRAHYGTFRELATFALVVQATSLATLLLIL
jgi:putative ABC transport system permease protein